MSRLSKEILSIKDKVDKYKLFLSSVLYEEIITEKDIFDFINNVDLYINKSNKKLDDKQEILFIIYSAPFILCDQELLSDNIKKILPNFLEYRYNSELEELDMRLNFGDINIEEYEKQKKNLDYWYYGSSLEGKKIKKNGFVKKYKNSSLKCI